MAAGRLPNPLPPMQSGVGGVANAVLSALARSELEHLSVYTEVMQDAVVELIDAGKVACASGTALTISPSARERFYAHIDDYKGKIILRPQELSNAPEVIRRLSIIAMNTAIEVDLAGNVNSTHIGEGDASMGAASAPRAPTPATRVSPFSPPPPPPRTAPSPVLCPTWPTWITRSTTPRSSSPSRAWRICGA